MIPYKPNWTKLDLIQLQQECNKYFEEDNPPPRSIIQGKINLRHFLYQNIKLQQTIKFNKDESNKTFQRILNCRELQIKELRKRIEKEKAVNIYNKQHDKRITELEIQNKKLNMMLKKIKEENAIYKTQCLKQSNEIENLNDIILRLEDKQQEESDSDQEDLDEDMMQFHRNNQIEPRSREPTPTKQDKDFIVNDLEDDISNFIPSENDSSDIEYSGSDGSI